MDETHFPHAGVGPLDLHPELFIRDWEFLNYHINHDKWRWYLGYTFQNAVRWGDDFLFEEVDIYVEAGDQGGDFAVIDMINGVGLIATGSSNDDEYEVFETNENRQLISGQPLYFEARIKVSDALQSDAYIGLINAAGLYNGNPADGVYFRKDDGDLRLYFCTRQNTVDTDVDTGIDAEDLGWVILAFHWDGAGNLRWFVFADGPEPQLCLATGTVTDHFAQDELFRFAMGARAGEADSAGKLLYCDYWHAAMKRDHTQ